MVPDMQEPLASGQPPSWGDVTFTLRYPHVLYGMSPTWSTIRTECNWNPEWRGGEMQWLRTALVKGVRTPQLVELKMSGNVKQLGTLIWRLVWIHTISVRSFIRTSEDLTSLTGLGRVSNHHHSSVCWKITASASFIVIGFLIFSFWPS